MGVWFDDATGRAFAYDGCTVSFVWPRDDYIHSLIFGRGEEIGVDLSAYGTPPFFRTRARWDGDLLGGSGAGVHGAFARWTGRGFSTFGALPRLFFRVRHLDELPSSVRGLLCVQESLPTDDELRSSLGLPPPHPPGTSGWGPQSPR